MATLTDTTVVSMLRQLKNAYKVAGTTFDDQRKRAYDLAVEVAGKDENYVVAASAGDIVDAFGETGPSFDLSLQGILRLFGPITGTASADRNVMIAKLARWMRDNSKVIKSRGTVHDAADQDPLGTKVGSQVLAVCSVMPDGSKNESATIETLTFRAEASATSRQGLGSEQYEVHGDAINDVSEFQSGGRGISDVRVKAFAPGVDSIVKNSSFDNPFQGSGTSKIPGGWEITSGDANIERVTAAADIAEDRGRNHGALRISGDCEIRYYFRKNGVSLNRVRPFCAAFRGKKAGAPTFSLAIDIGSAGATYPLDGSWNQGDFTTSYQDKRLNSDRRNAWADAFDEDGDPYIAIVISGSTFGGSEYFYLDDFVLNAMLQIGGRYCAIQSGLTATVKGDTMSQRCTLTRGMGSVELTGGGSGSVDSITVDGVELLAAAVPYNTSLAQTASDVVDAINEKVTFPNYVAELNGATIEIYQEKPVAGTLTVASTTTTITKTDTNLSGGAIGEMADFIVRRTGLHLPHDAAASTGYED